MYKGLGPPLTLSIIVEPQFPSLFPQHKDANCGSQMEDDAVKRNLRQLLLSHSRSMGDTWAVPRNESWYNILKGTQPRWDQSLSSFDVILLNMPDLFDLNINRLQYPESYEIVVDFDYSFVFGQGICTKIWTTVNPLLCLAGVYLFPLLSQIELDF